MVEPYTLSVESQPADEDARFIRERLNEFNWSRVEEDRYQPLAVFLRAADGAIVGGLIGNTYWGWLHVSILWMAEELRQHGYGRRLLQAAEHEAIRRGCRAAHLDTMSFHGALPFYQRQGYRVFGELHDLPLGHTRYFLQKALTPASAAD
jgi:GNAT superfamily N-acetyltransferase